MTRVNLLQSRMVEREYQTIELPLFSFFTFILLIMLMMPVFI